MRYLSIKGVRYDLIALQDFVRAYGEEECGGAHDRDELLRDLSEARGSSAHERKRFRVRCGRAKR